MKFNQTTYNLSLGIAIIFAIYTLIYSGLTGVLVCSSFALITAAFVDTFELVVASSIIFGLFYIYYLRKIFRKYEPFQNQDGPKKIAARVQGMEHNYHPVQQQLKDPKLEPQGVYDPSIEGFEDVAPKVPKEGASAESSSAPNNRENEVKHPVEQKKDEEGIKKEELGSATGNLFKMGQLPSENASGPHIDSGSTLLKAMESFKPEQISSMTEDTKKLIETQKNLMGMLSTMRPVLQDGKQLLDTFSGMFGNGGVFKL
jgi:hypothetical protein